jgi:hypothetical protein
MRKVAGSSPGLDFYIYCVNQFVFLFVYFAGCITVSNDVRTLYVVT